MRTTLPALMVLAALGGCGVWIDAASIPEVSPVDSSGTTETDSSTDSSTDTEPPPCARGEVEVFTGVPGDDVWTGQRIHLRFDAPVPPSDVEVRVTPRGNGAEAWVLAPFSEQLASDQVHVYEPPPEGWVPSTTHDVEVRYGSGCSYTGTFRASTLGAPVDWGQFGEFRVLADLSQAVVLPLGISVAPGTVESQVIVDFNESWDEEAKPAGATVAGSEGEELLPCGDSLYFAATGLGLGHGSIRVPHRNVAMMVDGREAHSVDGDVAVAVDFSTVAVPQMSLWVDVERLGGEEVCLQTACKACGASSTCALLLLEGAPAQRTNVDLPIRVFNCFGPGQPSCSDYCGG